VEVYWGWKGLWWGIYEGKKVMGKGLSLRNRVSYGGQRRGMDDKYVAVEGLNDTIVLCL
jgi:hypothetical protein